MIKKEIEHVTEEQESHSLVITYDIEGLKLPVTSKVYCDKCEEIFDYVIK
jgi:hypothetical protein